MEEKNTIDNTNNMGSQYHVVLANYDGALDALLDLVKRAKINIEDIFISDITEQYLAAMDQIDTLDMDQAADFIDVASTLLEIKSRALLPRQEAEDEQSDEPDIKKEFIHRLEEYKLYKEASEKIKEQEVVNMHFRSPDETVGQPRLVLKDMTTDGLVKALQKMFDKLGARQQAQKTRKINLDPFTVEEKITFIRDRINCGKKITFDELFNEDFTVNEVVTTFQALLELLKLQEVHAEQNAVFDTITISKRTD